MSSSGPSETHLRDYVVLLSGRLLRAFGFGFSAVLLAIYLQWRGLTSVQIGVVLTAGVLSASLTGLGLASLATHLGRRTTLSMAGVLMALSGIDLALAGGFWWMVLAALTGMIGAASTDLGPFLAVEQAVLTETVPPSGRNRAFGRYSLTAALAAAAGSLAAGLGTDLSRGRLFFLGFALIGLLTAGLPFLLSPAVEGQPEAPLLRSVRPLLGLSALFALDSFGGGLVTNSLVAFWLHQRFGASAEVLGPSFAAISLVVAASYEAAGWLGDRIGLVNTMVFTHLPSNILLILTAFSPNLAWAIAFLLARNAISQMDIPVRQAYVVSIVKPNERAGALATTGAIRGVAQACGPVLTGLAIQVGALAVPFVVSGGVKIVYDLGLYRGFRRHLGDHERVKPR